MKNKGFQDTADRIEKLISAWQVKLLQMSDELIVSKRNTQNRNIKEIVGHMIDSAANNHQRIVRLQYTETLDFPDYRQDNDTWIGIQKYQEEDWSLMINLWKYYNLHLVHLFTVVDSECLTNEWTDFEGANVSLGEMIEGYLVHLELHLLEINDLAQA